MALLTGELRRRVLQMLIEVPDVRLVVVRRSLVAGLPDAVKACVAEGPANAEIVNLLDAADGDAWWELPDGTFSVIKVVENALFNVRGSRLEPEAVRLLDELKHRALGLGARPTTAAPSGPPTRTGDELQLLQDALLAAFPSRDDLEILLRFRMSTKLDEVAGGENLRSLIFHVMGWAESEGRLDELVTVALAENPGNSSLRTAAERMGLVPSSASPPGTAEALSGEPDSESGGLFSSAAVASTQPMFFETRSFLTGLGQSEKAVCRVEVGDPVTGYATGFLVGPSAVMTSYPRLPTDHSSLLRFRFDYAMGATGTANEGTVYNAIDGDWMIDSDSVLNFALVRVDGVPGDEQERGWTGASPRRWLRPLAAHQFIPHDPLFVIQHPLAGPRQVAMQSDSIIGLSKRGTEFRYRMSSERGSGGSPCFNADWELIGLHLGRQPDGICFGTPMPLIAARPAVQAALGT